jgi:hypothetical protein
MAHHIQLQQQLQEPPIPAAVAEEAAVAMSNQEGPVDLES